MEALDGEEDRVGDGVLVAEEGEEHDGDVHREDLDAVALDEPVVDEQHREVDEEVAEDRADEEVEHPARP